MKKVKNHATPTKTVLGGVCAVPKAWRKIDSTMMMRTNEVIISNIDGNSVRPSRGTLVKQGLIFDSGRVRHNKKGNNCIVWVAGSEGMML